MFDTDTCNLCHEATDYPNVREGRTLCSDCADGWDYYGSLTPTERRIEDASQAVYVSLTEGGV